MYYSESSRELSTVEDGPVSLDQVRVYLCKIISAIKGVKCKGDIAKKASIQRSYSQLIPIQILYVLFEMEREFSVELPREILRGIDLMDANLVCKAIVKCVKDDGSENDSGTFNGKNSL